jgi:hypothetical protein
VLTGRVTTSSLEIVESEEVVEGCAVPEERSVGSAAPGDFSEIVLELSGASGADREADLLGSFC